MSCSSTNHRGDDGDCPFGPLYDPTTPNWSLWANLRIVGPKSKHPGSLYFSCSSTKNGTCKFFRWCLPISGNVEVSTTDGTHIAVLETKVHMLQEHARVMKTINRGLLWCLLAAIVVIFITIMIAWQNGSTVHFIRLMDGLGYEVPFWRYVWPLSHFVLSLFHIYAACLEDNAHLANG